MIIASSTMLSYSIVWNCWHWCSHTISTNASSTNARCLPPWRLPVLCTSILEIFNIFSNTLWYYCRASRKVPTQTTGTTRSTPTPDSRVPCIPPKPNRRLSVPRFYIVNYLFFLNPHRPPRLIPFSFPLPAVISLVVTQNIEMLSRPTWALD